MNSINENQPERNHADLEGGKAIAKIRELVREGQNCFFRTAVQTGPTRGVRPMNVRRIDEDGTIWFLSASDSHQNQEIAVDPAVNLYFQGSKHSDFLHLSGRVTVSTDREVIKELWEPLLKTWFTGGVDDPRVTVLRFAPAEGYYWDTKHGSVVALVKMLVGAAAGVTLDDSVEGTVRV